MSIPLLAIRTLALPIVNLEVPSKIDILLLFLISVARRNVAEDIDID